MTTFHTLVRVAQLKKPIPVLQSAGDCLFHAGNGVAQLKQDVNEANVAQGG